MTLPSYDLDLLHQREAEALRAAALDLTFEGLRVHGPADLLRGRELDHPHKAQLDVHVHDGAVRGERELEVGVALAVAGSSWRGGLVAATRRLLDELAGLERRPWASQRARTAWQAA